MMSSGAKRRAGEQTVRLIIKKEQKYYKLTFLLHCITTCTRKQVLYKDYFYINNKTATISDLERMFSNLKNKKNLLHNVKILQDIL